MMTDHEKLKALMKERGLNFFDISEITGHSYNSIKSMLQPNQKLPRWMKLVLYVWEGGKKEKDEIIKKYESQVKNNVGLANVVGRSRQLHSCKYVKRIGESCTLNNNCKYPNCE